ncbi:glycoside hydrolase family 65 protein [Phocaeicola coprocola]|uniref:glycoside hydrolase family 65 protein n=1 Tax=Phocaeicola coprocola TaxID=310298 RepID=UPI0019579289|nr:glycoside hydrolase family 65 protein [Phocaeicola coprocola]MBM6904076.1 glycoside hydrolase family 65 protein [Phocaeicola coprocola]
MRIHALCFILGIILSATSIRAEEERLWQLHAVDIQAPYAPAPMANGCIGILPQKEPFAVEHVMLNHVFDAASPHIVSRVMRGINPFCLSMKIDKIKVDTSNISDWQQTIDMRRAVHQTSFHTLEKADVSYELCALRNLPYAGLIRVTVQACKDMLLEVRSGMGIPDDYSQSLIRYREMEADGNRMYMLESDATSRFGYRRVASTSSFLFNGEQIKPIYDEATRELFFSIQLKKGETFCFSLVGSVCSSRDFFDPYNEAERQVIYAVHEGEEALMQAHYRLWDELWQGDIRIEGDDDAQRIVRFALFNLYSSCRGGSRLSIPPMGLSLQGYNGHIFWDTELWMYPPMLLLNQDIARSMLDYRFDRLPAARKKALAYGYRGAMFPWESDDSGEEATPTHALTGPFEHHITADIGIACWNYYCVTRDMRWLQREGYPLLKEIADFWASRVTRNQDGSYSIHNVTGADEYANGVTDNAFTNGAASLALKYACQAAEICGEKVPELWWKIGENIRILQFENGVTREHSTYKGEIIKQADANLLAYPLGLITDEYRQRQDLEYYAERIDQKDGPAMSYSVYCVQYARMGEADKAYEMFRRCYEPNLRKPFGVISETPTSNNPYFMTGAGGLLQAVLNGFCGLQITDEGIVQLPSALPSHWKRVTVTGVGSDKKTYVRER